ncbi:fasciclin domain-containing protein [Ilumatobacter sp.]|uniref:fasciclin domain-containing protein n=1 Tax=Ilumatobacter sp. TaxID=1967498 RepID=UPI003B517CC3
MRKSTRSILALGAAVSFTAAACGSDSNDATDAVESVTTEAMAETSDAMTETSEMMTEDTDAMTESTDAMTESTDAMTETTDAMTESTDAMTESTDAMTETTDAMTEGTGGEAMAMEPSGPLCAEVPEEGDGSFAGMTEDPAATAASNNPALSTLVTAVDAAGLVDTLNGDGPFTIFAPANPAFDAIPQEDLDALLADTEQLTTVLTYHVVGGEQLASTDLAEMDMVTTVQGGDIMLSMEDGTLTLNDGQATVGCADVQTANATVHIIDGVLMPTG